MTKEDIQLLFEYDRWANKRVLNAAGGLSPEQFTRDLGGAFASVRDTLMHIVGGQWIWLAYWRNPPGSAQALAELRARRDALFHPQALPGLAAVQLKWTEVEADLNEFLSRLPDEAFQQMIPFRATQVRLGGLMQHVANHSTYHRGQVALMMRQLGAEPLATDFHQFLAERK